MVSHASPNVRTRPRARLSLMTWLPSTKDQARRGASGHTVSVMGAEGGPTWSEIASWYDELLSSGSGPHETAVECLRLLLPNLSGAAVLDVACGQGLATRAIAADGAHSVVGTDLSESMIDIARGHEFTSEATPISYVVDDAQTLSTFEDASFDGVTCQLGLMDIPNLDAALASIHRVLRPGGWFVFVIGHPCFLVPDATATTDPDGRPAVVITDYFSERFWRSRNPNGVRRAGNHHRTLSTYLNGLIATGFAIDAVTEPKASGALAAQQPLYAEVPIFLAARVTRRR
jgi:ubiquinone/menaquinone biosynthesis C-methylase UbiE